MAGKGNKLGSNTPASAQHPALPHPQPPYPSHPTTGGAFGQGVFGHTHDPIAAELAAWQYREGMPEGHSPEAANAAARLAQRAPKRKA